MSDLEIVTAQLESWVDNKTKVGLMFENGFCVGLNEYGTLDRSEGHFVFNNSVANVMFDPHKAIPEARFEDSVYQVRLKYGCGMLSIFDPRWAHAI